MDKKILKVTGTIEAWFELEDIDEETARRTADVRLSRELSCMPLPDVGDGRFRLKTYQYKSCSEIAERPALKRYKVELAIEQRSTMDVFIRAEDEHAAGLKAAAMLDDPNHDRSEYVMDWDYCEDSVPYVVGEVDEDGNLI